MKGLLKAFFVKHTALGTHFLLFENVVRLVVGVVTSAILFRYLPVDVISTWGVITSWLVIFSTFSTAGVDTILVASLHLEREALAKRFTSLFILRLGASVISIFVSLLLACFFYTDIMVRASIFALSIGWIPQAASIMEYYFQGFGLIRRLTAIRLSVLVISFSAKIFALIYFQSLSWFVVASLIEAVLSGAIYLHQAFRSQLLVFHNLPSLKEIIFLFKSQTVYLMISTFFMNINFRFDQLLLQKNVDAFSMAGYFAIVRLFEILTMFPTVVANAHMKNMSSALSDDNCKFEKAIERLTKDLLLVSMCLILLVTVFGWVTLRVIFGLKFTVYLPHLILLSAGIIFISLSISKGWFMTLRGLFKENMWTSFYGAFVNIFLNLVLIPRFGIWGSIFSSLVSYLVYGYLSAFSFGSLKPYTQIVKNVFCFMSKGVKHE